MKKFLVLFAAMAMAFTACEPNNQPTPGGSGNGNGDDAVLTLTSEGALIFGATGGMGTIEYTLENAADDSQVTATTDTDWIINFNYGDNTVTFTVKRNMTNFSRSGNVTVSYGEQSFDVMVNQKSNTEIDESVEAPNLVGIYYGNRDKGDYNYYIMLTDGELTDHGMVDDGMGNSFREFTYDTPNAYYYFVDLFCTTPDNGDLHIPDGTYTLDLGNTGRGNKFMQGYSIYRINDDKGQISMDWSYSEGTLTVEGNKFDLIVTLYDYENGVRIGRHHVSFEGDYELYDDSI